MAFGKRRIIGLDIGETRVKAVLLEQSSKSEVAIRDYAVDRSEGEGVPLVERLRGPLRQLRTRCRECAISAWPAGSRLRMINPTAEPDLFSAIKTGSHDPSALFFEELDEHVVECGEIGRLNGKSDGSTMLASGVPSEELDAIERALRKLGYRISLFQLTPVAVLNAFAASHTDDMGKQPFILVDFGKARMTIIGGCRGAVQMIRRVEFSWGEIPEPLVSAEHVDGSEDASASEFEEQALAAIFGEVSDLLAAELQPLLDFFQNQDHVVPLQQIHVSGGLSNHRTVVRRLVERLGLPCVQWNPFRSVGAHQRALKDFTLFSDLAHLPAAAGAAFQCVA
jgi:Tfp pilus assembly PilM family ATPase